MKFVTYLLLGSLIFGIFRTRRGVKRAQTAKERAFIIRTAATAWLLGFLFVLALTFLPNKGRVLLMLPGFFLTVTLGKAWQNSRKQLRERQAQTVDLEKMKRAN